MTATNLFHVGVLVPDIEKAMDRFSAALGLTFKDPEVAHVDAFEQPSGMSVLDLRITWSLQGPPYLELLESQDNDGLYGHHHVGLHHVGLWEPDPVAMMERLLGMGLMKEAIQWSPEGKIIAAYTAPRELYGTRLEFIEGSRRPGMEAWLAGAPWAD